MSPTAVRSISRPTSRGAAILAVLLAGLRLAAAESPGGALMGLVEDAKGAPLSGAVISLFGRGVGAGGLVTLSDAAGHFFVPSLPPGPYTLRALRDGHTPAAARRVLILPNQDASFTISMAPVSDALRDREVDASTAKDKDDAARDLQWLVRHKRRSALEERKDGPTPATSTEAAPASGLLASLLPDLGGTVELLTRPAGSETSTTPRRPRVGAW